MVGGVDGFMEVGFVLLKSVSVFDAIIFDIIAAPNGLYCQPERGALDDRSRVEG